MLRRALLLIPLVSSIPASGQLASSEFAYQKPAIQIQELSSKSQRGLRIVDVRFTGIDGSPIPAYVIGPSNGCMGPRKTCAGVLFVHWYDEKAGNSDRSEFLPEAYDLARHGAVSLLVDAMWAKPNWFEQRNPADDYAASIAQVKNLRRAVDVLSRQPGVNPSRIGFVGHDFGMMFGAILAGVDHRVRTLALMAATSCLSDWYLLGRKLSAAEQQQVKVALAPLCPVLYLPHATGPVLLQFATNDPYVPLKNAQSLANAAPEPKLVRYYDAGHALNAQARIERLEWLELRLRLRPEREE